MWCKRINCSFVCITNIHILSAAAVEDVTLSSTLTIQLAYPDQVIIFTCTTRGSGILEWRSDEYIGSSTLQILSLSSAPSSVVSRSNSDTVATRVSTTTENGVLVITSELQITASTLYPTSTIICGNSGDGSTRNITFQTAGESYTYI